MTDLYLIETKRLLLREINTGDADVFYQLNADPEVMKYTGDEPFASVEEALIFIQNYPDYKRNGFGRWAVITKNEGKTIGWCGLKLNEDGEIDLGYRFFRES